MESKAYKKSVVAHIVSVIRNFIAVTFVLCLFFIVVSGDFAPVIGLWQIVLLGTIIYEYFTVPSFIVRADGVVYKRANTTRTLGYSVYHFRSNGKSAFTIQDRRSSRTETLTCSGFDKKLFAALAGDIERRQTEYFFKRTASGEFSSNADAEKASVKKAPASSDAPRTYTTPKAAEQASRNNPYSKSYKGRDQNKSEKTAAVSETAKKTVSEPAITVGIPDNKLYNAELPDTKINETPKVDVPSVKIDDIPSDYNKLPEIGKIDDTVLKVDYVSKPVEAVPPKRTNVSPEFAKIEFRYPRRAIVENGEHKDALLILWTWLAGVALFLVMHVIQIADSSNELLLSALMIAAVCGGITAVVSVGRRNEIRQTFSKLEITGTHLVIDNKRFKYKDISSPQMTAPIKLEGERIMSFRYDGKLYTYRLGKCAKPAKKRELRYFTRYTELAKLLRERGFAFR